MGVKDKVYDILHQGALATLFFISGIFIYDGVHGYYTHNQQKKQWNKKNVHWDDDPYYVYNANFMRIKKKTEEEIVYCRPQYYAAKDLRERLGMAMQPPYEISDEFKVLRDMDGKELAADNDGYQGLTAATTKK